MVDRLPCKQEALGSNPSRSMRLLLLCAFNKHVFLFQKCWLKCLKFIIVRRLAFKFLWNCCSLSRFIVFHLNMLLLVYICRFDISNYTDKTTLSIGVGIFKAIEINCLSIDFGRGVREAIKKKLTMTDIYVFRIFCDSL